MTLSERAAQLRQIEKQLPGRLKDAGFRASLRAIETAVDHTPPTMDDLSGTNTRSGEMKQHWVADSRPMPEKRGDAYVSELNNSKEYASYVNDGHDMDRHFVPGLVVNPASGMLEHNPDGKGGIIVGTQTAYVPGLYMADKAKQTYKEVLREEIKDLEALLE